MNEIIGWGIAIFLGVLLFQAVRRPVNIHVEPHATANADAPAGSGGGTSLLIWLGALVVMFVIASAAVGALSSIGNTISGSVSQVGQSISNRIDQQPEEKPTAISTPIVIYVPVQQSAAAAPAESSVLTAILPVLAGVLALEIVVLINQARKAKQAKSISLVDEFFKQKVGRP